MKLSKRQWFILIILVLGFVASSGILPFVFATILAFIPAYYYLKSIRNTEEKDVEPWEAIWTAFVWGGLSGIFLAMILNSIGTLFILSILHENSSEESFENMAIFVGAVIVAPIVEEFVKPLVMFRNSEVKKEIDEVEDGIVYGAACGLGFGATENVVYGLSEEALAAGIGGIFLIIVLRTFSSILLHLVTTSFTGYGIAKYQVKGESFSVVIKYYLLAVLIHAGWNAMAISSLVFDNDLGSILLFFTSIGLAILGLEMTKRRIREIDVAGSNISGTNIRAETDEWSNDREERISGWDEKRLNSSNLYAGETANPLYSSNSKTGQELVTSTKNWVVNYDWKGALATLGSLIFMLMVVVF